MTQIKIEQRDPAHLKPLAVVKTMVRWAPDSTEFAAFKEDIKENGIKHPIQITSDDQVVDGWTRVLAARAWGDKFLTVPCVVVSEHEALEIVLRELVLRRNLTKGQQAYVTWPFLEDVRLERKARGKVFLQINQQNLVGTLNVLTRKKLETDWTKLLGVSDTTMDQAGRLHGWFEKDEDLRAEWEPKILNMDKPESLGGVIAGIGGKEATDGKARGSISQPELFRTMVGGGANQAEFWQDHRQAALEILQKKTAKLKADKCEALAAMHADIAKFYRDEAKAKA